MEKKINPSASDNHPKNLAHKRAAFAFERVKEVVENLKDDEQGNYRAYVNRLPMMVRTSGLAAAFAFTFAKSKDSKAHACLLRHGADWLASQGIVLKKDAADPELFLQKLTSMDLSRTRWAVQEIFSLFTWLKRFSDGMIEKKQTATSPAPAATPEPSN